MARLVDVGLATELEDAVPKAVQVGPRRLVLLSWRGELFALKDVCPHQNQSFVGGFPRCLITGGEPGEVSMERDRPVLVCPWHHWTFDVQTGVCTHDPDSRVRSYPVVREGDRIMVDMEG